MVTRVFLGWDQPFLTAASAWMAGRGADWSDTLVVVPTAQSGRRLRESLAEACGGAVLSPQMTTPGMLLRGPDMPDACESWEEELAWVAALESINGWEPYQAIMPEPDREDSAWAVGLAREFTALRRELAENGHTLGTAAKRLAETVEAGRWHALAGLETRVISQMRSWGLRDRSRPFSEILPPAGRVPRILLAGVPELPPVVAAALERDDRPVTALIAAPEADGEHFSPCGIPLACWLSRELPWPENRVHLAVNPRDQAHLALQAIAATCAPSDSIAIGCADAEVGEQLARILNQHGWPAFHPAAPVATEPLVKWWRTFAKWLIRPDFAALAELLAFSQSGKLVSGARYRKSIGIHRMMDRAMVRDAGDLRHRLEHDPDFLAHPDPAKALAMREDAASLLEAATAMESWRARYLRGEFLETTRIILEIISTPDDATAGEIEAWMTRAEPRISRLQKPAAFWIDVMLGALPSPSPTPPDDRVIDVQGWLEVFHEPGIHLILCGLNEGRVPSRSSGETWLGEAARSRLGLITGDSRAARDAFLFHALIRARSHGSGSVDVFCGKCSIGGDALLPSRLLLTGSGQLLATRVRTLFRELEPPDSGLRNEPDGWKWRPPVIVAARMPSATALRDYLACPLRFYLKHVLRMRRPEPHRGEWNARDFGNIIHKTLENWGSNRTLHSRPEDDIAGHLLDEADRLITLGFDGKPPLAVRIQREAVHQRLRWTARILAGLHAEGWDVLETETPIRLTLPGGAEISGTIDRIDRHRESGAIRIIDYKTGKLGERKSAKVEAAHRVKATTAVIQRCAHLPVDSPAWHEATDAKGNPQTMLWQNLQLPLYVAAVAAEHGTLPAPCYLTIGDSFDRVDLHIWECFQQRDVDAAVTCADWITERIRQGVFLPAAAAVPHDDFEDLLAGLTWEEVLDWQPD